ncbi:Cyclin-A1 [Chytriomyces hyalinus]|nr:Cyclin-A1 [Chytriomyces hyalinus]
MSELTPTRGRGLVTPMDDLIQKVAAADPDKFDVDDIPLGSHTKKFREEMDNKSSTEVAAADLGEFDEEDIALMARAKKFREELEKKSQLALPPANFLLPPRLHEESVTAFQPQQQKPQQPAEPFSFGNNMRHEFKIATPAGRTSWRETASNSLASSPLKSASRSPAPALFINPVQESFYRHQASKAELYKMMRQDFSKLKKQLSANARTPEEKRLLHFRLTRLQSYQERESLDGKISTCLHNQVEINVQSRMVLCHWMSELCADEGFLRTTFHRSIVYLDAFLARHANFPLDYMQVLGSAAVFSAAKLEEPEALSKHLFLNFGDDDPKVLAEHERLLQKFHAAMVMRQVAVKATPYEWLQLFLDNLQQWGYVVSEGDKIMYVRVLDVMVLVAETGQYASSLLAAATLFLHGYVDSDAISVATGYELTVGHTVVAHLRDIWEFVAAKPEDGQTHLGPIQPQIGMVLEEVVSSAF